MQRRNNFLIYVSLFCLTFLLSACFSNSGVPTGGQSPNEPLASPDPTDGPEPEPSPTPKPTIKPTPTPSPSPRPKGTPGDFNSTGIMNEYDVASYQNLGCMTQGSGTPKKMIDPRLNPGDKFREYIYIDDDQGPHGFTLETVTKTVSSYTSTGLATVKSSNIPEITPGMISNQSCEVRSDTDGECGGTASVGITGVNIFVFLGGNPSVTWERGWYVLDDGFGTPSWKQEVVTTGIILDPAGFKFVGPGTQVETKIFLTDIPSLGIEFCGGTEGVNDTTVTTDQGVVLNRIGARLLGFKGINN